MSFAAASSFFGHYTLFAAQKQSGAAIFRVQRKRAATPPFARCSFVRLFALRHAGLLQAKALKEAVVLVHYFKAALPEVQLVLVEPFVLKGQATEPQWDYFRDETELRRQTTVRLAEKYGAKLLPTQKLFSDAADASCAANWSADGVHPTPGGHWMLAQAWLELCKDIL